MDKLKVGILGLGRVYAFQKFYRVWKRLRLSVLVTAFHVERTREQHIASVMLGYDLARVCDCSTQPDAIVGCHKWQNYRLEHGPGYAAGCHVLSEVPVLIHKKNV